MTEPVAMCVVAFFVPVADGNAGTWQASQAVPVTVAWLNVEGLYVVVLWQLLQSSEPVGT